MAARHLRRTTSARGKRAPTNWARLVLSTHITVPALTKVALTSIALSNPGIGETIRRSRGTIAITSDQLTSTESQMGAVGLIVVTEAAAAVGITAIPDPVSNASDDGWFVYQGFTQRDLATGGNVTRNFWPFDSKAMRRVEEGFEIVVVVANAHATDGFKIGFSMSMLTSSSS